MDAFYQAQHPVDMRSLNMTPAKNTILVESIFDTLPDMGWDTPEDIHTSGPQTWEEMWAVLMADFEEDARVDIFPLWRLAHILNQSQKPRREAASRLLRDLCNRLGIVCDDLFDFSGLQQQLSSKLSGIDWGHATSVLRCARDLCTLSSKLEIEPLLAQYQLMVVRVVELSHPKGQYIGRFVDMAVGAEIRAQMRDLQDIEPKMREALRALVAGPKVGKAPSSKVESKGDDLSEVEVRHKKQLSTMRGYLEGKGFFQAARALEIVRSLEKGNRKDGKTPKLHHQLSVTRLITTLLPHLQYPEETITVAFLHDVIEDHSEVWDQAKLEKEFGSLVAQAVWSLSKKTTGLTKSYDSYFEGMSNCPIASVVKLADRAHNIQTMVGVFSLSKQVSYLEEVGTWFFPMIRTARRQFPSQYPAYENLKILLRCQCHLIQHIHEAQAAARNPGGIGEFSN